MRVHRSLLSRCPLLPLVQGALLLLALAPRAHAQTTAMISGFVKDESGGVLPGVTVTAKSLETGAVRTSVTGDSGTYTLVSLPVGRYDVKAELAGFRTALRSGINLTVGQDVTINFDLGLGTLDTAITVKADTPLVNTGTVSTSGLVGEREVKDLPLNGRSFDNLITLNPGTVNVTSQRGGGGVQGNGNLFSISGRRPQENLFLMNGVSFTGASAQGNMPGGVSGQLLGIDAVREFNVQKGVYSAEFGGRAGGQINVVTMSGTNDFHGSVFEFMRDDALDSRNFFDKGAAPPFRRDNYGFAAGGPVIPNRTFVFGNYEALGQRLGLSSVAIVPDDNARRGLLPNRAEPGTFLNVGVAPGVAPYLALWPAANGRNFGDGTAESFSNPKQTIDEKFATVRFDHTLSARDSINGVYTFDDGSSTTPADNPLNGTLIELRTQVFSLQHTRVLSPHVFNTARFGFTRAAYHFDSRPLIDLPPALAFIQGQPVGQIRIGAGTGGSVGSLSLAGANSIGHDQVTIKNLFTYQDNLQITHERHLFGLGVSIVRLQSNQDIALPKHGQAVFGTLSDFLQGRMSQFSAMLNHQLLGWRQTQAAWYVQDTFKLTPRLTLNAGLRHEISTGWNEKDGHAANFILGSNNVLETAPHVGDSPFLKNNALWLFAPRLGVAWDPTGKGKTAIRAGFGIHYTIQDELALALASNPPVAGRIDLGATAFPIQLVPGTPVAGASVRPGVIDSNMHTPRVARYTLAVQQEVTPKIAVEIGYTGSRGYNSAVNMDVNTAFPIICSTAAGNCPAGLPDGTQYFLDAQGRTLPRRNPALLDAGPSWFYLGRSAYNALEIETVGRSMKGLSFRGNYTLSKSMDDASLWTTNDALGDVANAMDSLNPHHDYGPSAFDIRHRASVNLSYEVPFHGTSGMAGALLGGWQINGIVNLQSGLPFTPKLGFSRSRNGNPGGGERPNVNPGADLDSAITGDPNQWFDPTVFTLPVNGTYGNAGRGILRGPGLATVDTSVFKTIHITGGVRAQLRVEAFNVLNRTNFGLPSNIVFNADGTYRGSAGRITNTSTTSRQIQLGAKVIW